VALVRDGVVRVGLIQNADGGTTIRWSDGRIRSAMRIAIALLATGCYGTVSRPTCSLDRTDVADDEVNAAGTAVDLLAATAGARDVLATLEDGTPVGATVEVVRGDGSAQWVDREPDSDETRVWGGGGILLIAVTCDDTLEVPAIGTLTTDDGVFDVAVDGTLSSGATPMGSEGPGFDARVPFAGSGYPAPDEPEIASYDHQKAFLEIGFAEERTSGQAGWSGDRVLPDGTGEWRAHYQVTW
jgi:hypothetical protein